MSYERGGARRWPRRPAGRLAAWDTTSRRVGWTPRPVWDPGRAAHRAVVWGVAAASHSQCLRPAPGGTKKRAQKKKKNEPPPRPHLSVWSGQPPLALRSPSSNPAPPKTPRPPPSSIPPQPPKSLHADGAPKTGPRQKTPPSTAPTTTLKAGATGSLAATRQPRQPTPLAKRRKKSVTAAPCTPRATRTQQPCRRSATSARRTMGQGGGRAASRLRGQSPHPSLHPGRGARRPTS